MKSIPRDIKSVQIKIQILPMRKFLMISSRSSFFLSACITSTLIPSNLSSLYNYLARSLLCTKISIGGLYPSAKTCLSVASFPSSDPVYINFYLTVVAVAFLIPTWTLMGSSVIICFITYSHNYTILRVAIKSKPTLSIPQLIKTAIYLVTLSIQSNGMLLMSV